MGGEIARMRAADHVTIEKPGPESPLRGKDTSAELLCKG